MKLRLFLPLLVALLPLRAEEPDYFPAVAKLIEDRCMDCHSADDPDGKLVMEKHADILKGGNFMSADVRLDKRVEDQDGGKGAEHIGFRTVTTNKPSNAE